MHNNIMAAGSRDRPPMLTMGRYAQWKSRFLRYIDKRTNGDALRKCILEEKEAIHLLLTGIGDEIYSTVDACKTAHEMWIAIKRLQQGESLNIQDVKTNLFWEFRKFTSHDGESMESYYSRFYKMMNEMIRNNLTVATMQVNVQFLQQLQPEWSRFVTIVKQQHDLDTVSYHKLFDVLKQYQKEVNEIRAEERKERRIAKNANPLALVAAAQQYPDTYYQAPQYHKPYALTTKQASSTRSNASIKFKGKEIAKPITPLSESASEEDSDPEQAQRYKDMQKKLALIANKSHMVLGIASAAIIDHQLPFEYTITSISTDVVVMAQPIQNINHSAFRSMFKREKLSGNNFNDWFRQLMLVIEQSLLAAPAADSNTQVLAEWNALYDAYNEVACLMLGSMTPELHRQFENYSPYEMLQELKSMLEKQAEVERFNLIQTFHACKHEEGKLVVAYVLQMKGYVDQLERLGYMLPQDLIVGLILNGLTKDFAGFMRNYNMHNMRKTIG
ncbi:hypothetical protein Tco_0624093 [Tanacetum coccineum]|uniref:Gag protein n=1 Tax=Tanacetum coccineum TaxID=301880 RepID=A0ABQ4WCX4_9ASTR